MVSLNAAGRGLILPQLNVIDIVDSSWESLPIGRSGWKVDWEGKARGVRRRG